MDKKVIDLLVNVVGSENILLDEPMSKHTTFRIGGPADIFVMPQDVGHIRDILNICKENNIDYYVIGRGSNLLVGDKGYRGVVISIGNNFEQFSIEKISVEDNSDNESESSTRYIVKAQAGIMLTKLSRIIADKSLKGFEFAAGIPGTLGGAVTMNAGAYDGEIKNCIVSATVMTSEGEVLELDKEQLELSYRMSVIQKKEYIVLEAVFNFEVGNKEDIINKIDDFNQRRRDKQPLEYPSAGSTFKRPEGYFAGKLIMDSGLAGYRVGDACVSEKHCGFVINLGKATAKDTITLMKNVDDIVFGKYGVHLEPEVRVIGEF